MSELNVENEDLKPILFVLRWIAEIVCWEKSKRIWIKV